MKHFISEEASRKRIANWMMTAHAVDVNPTWIERRQAIEFGGHTYLIGKGQVFACVNCGHYDPEFSATEVLQWFEETLGIKPHDIEITCSVAIVPKEK